MKELNNKSVKWIGLKCLSKLMLLRLFNPYLYLYCIFEIRFTLLCGAGSTVPREGFDSSVIMPFSWCVVTVTLPI